MSSFDKYECLSTLNVKYRHCIDLGVCRVTFPCFQGWSLILSSRQLTASDINFVIVRPLVFKYAKLDNMAVVYACFVARSHFLSQAEENIAYSGVLLSRAGLCEILAMKLLGHFASNKMRLILALTASWSPLAGAPVDVVDDVRHIVGDDDIHNPQCALEVEHFTSVLCHSVLSCYLDGDSHRIKGVLVIPGCTTCDK